jgi:ATP-dependent Clp protease ATP-binding subunit ClpC
VTVTQGVSGGLVKTTCQDRAYGARPLRRGIQRYIEDALSEELIRGEFPAEGRVEVYLEGDRLAFRSTTVETSSPQQT